MDDSTLNILPTEILNKIFNLVLHHKPFISLRLIKREGCQGYDIKYRNAKVDLAMTLVCRQMREQALSVFFGANDFRFIASNAARPFADTNTPTRIAERVDALRRWLDNAGDGVKEVRSFTIQEWHMSMEHSDVTEGRIGRSFIDYTHLFVANQIPLRIAWSIRCGPHYIDVDLPLDDSFYDTLKVQLVYDIKFSADQHRMRLLDGPEIQPQLSAYGRGHQIMVDKFMNHLQRPLDQGKGHCFDKQVPLFCTLEAPQRFVPPPNDLETFRIQYKKYGYKSS